jgi:histidinol-phosphate aminotransferase
MVFCEAVAEAYGVGVENVFCGNGSDEILAFCFGAFFGDGVLFPDVSYSFYPVFARLWGTAYREVPLREDFSINLDDYLPADAPACGVIYPNPNAPTGMAVPGKESALLASKLEKLGQVLIIDNAYADFADPLYRFPSTVYLPANVLRVHTLSKSASLAGLRAGFAIGDAGLIEGLCRLRDSFNSYTLDRLALAGAAAAIRDAAYYAETTRRVIATRTRTTNVLRQLGFRVLPSQSNFIFIEPPAQSGVGGKALFTALRERGILVRRFDQPRIANFLRVSIGTDTDMDAFLGECQNIIQG